MKLFNLKLQSVVLFCLMGGFLQAQKVPFDDPKWVFEGGNSIIENFMGENSIYLQNGIAYLKNEEFKNGIIEFDIYFSERVSFAGVIFRMADVKNYEEIYFRGHHSGHPDAYQYTPVFNGMSGWQIYHDLYQGINDGLVSWKSRGENLGFNGVLNLPFSRWTHIKLIVSGTNAEMYFDGEENPSVVIKKLKRNVENGSIGLKCGAGPVHYANFSFKKIDNPVLRNSKDYSIKSPANTIKQWQISNAFNESEIISVKKLKKDFLNKFKWQKLNAEETGLANISKIVTRDKNMNTVFAKLVIESEKDQIKRLDIGYSDRVIAYCNDQILYSGNNGFRTRDYRYLGTIGYFDAVYLPLKKGKNTILLAVSESFGGWGLQGKLENFVGIKLQ